MPYTRCTPQSHALRQWTPPLRVLIHRPCVEWWATPPAMDGHTTPPPSPSTSGGLPQKAHTYVPPEVPPPHTLPQPRWHPPIPALLSITFDTAQSVYLGG